MRKTTLIAVLGMLFIALLFSACSSSAPVTPTTTTPTPQEQVPVQTTPVSTEPTPTTPTTSAPSESTNPTTTVTQPEPTPVEPTPTVTGVTASELALHNSKSDCWVVYKDEVYDVTEFLPKHPGGVLAISKHCGKLTFEKAFSGQHGTSQVSRLKASSINMGAYLG